MRDNGQDHVDAIIDDAARAMTAAAPPVSLRSAVRRRIDRPARTRSYWQPGLAVAAIVFVALIAGRAWLRVTREPEVPRTTVEKVVATAPPPQAAGPLPVAPGDAPPIQVRRRGPVPPPPPPEPIAIEPLVLEPVDPMVLAIETIASPMPLDIMPIVVEPLSIQ